MRGNWRSLLAWSGIALLGVIAALAAAHLALDLVRAVRRLEHPSVLPGLLLAGLAVLGGALALIVTAHLAARGRQGERLALVLGLALLVGIRMAAAATQAPPLTGEMARYDELAAGVLTGQCCFADRPLGYPILLAGAYGLLGRTDLAAESLDILLALLAGIGLFALVRASYGRSAAGLALVAFALWPAGALVTGVRLPETAYEAVVVLGALAVIHTPAGWKGSALTGVLLAVGQYLRPTTPALFLVYLLARVWPSAPRRQAVMGGALPMLAAFLLLLAPVVADNLRVRGDPSISTSAYGGWSLYVGTNSASGGRWNAADARRISALGGTDPWERSRIAGPLGVQRIVEDPPRFVLLAVRKFDTLWGTEDYGVQYGIDRRLPNRPEATFPALASQGFYAAVTGAATLGLVFMRRRPDALAVLAIGVTAVVTAIHVFPEVRDRYHAYAIPLLIAVAAGGLGQWRASRAERSTQGRPAGETPQLSPSGSASGSSGILGG